MFGGELEGRQRQLAEIYSVGNIFVLSFHGLECKYSDEFEFNIRIY